MLFKTLLFCLLTIFSAASAYVIPFRRVSTELSSLPNVDLASHPRAFILRRQQTTTLVAASVATNMPTGEIRLPDLTPAIPTTTITITATPSQSMTPTVSPSNSSLATTTEASNTLASSASQPPSPASTSTPSVTAESSQPSQPPADQDGSPKYVVAHHMVGNTFPYTIQDWKDDITLAHASGIDAFALNMGTDDWQPARVSDAYEAAVQTGLNFKLFISLDMSSFPCASPDDAQTLRNLVSSYVSHPNQFQYASRAFVSTFSGETCQFGQGSVPNGWKNQFTQHPQLQGKIYFVPAFFIDPATFKNFAGVIDGDFNWNSGWPIEVTNQFAQTALSNFNGSSNITQFGSSRLSTSAGSLAASVAASVSSILSKAQLALSQFIGSTTTDDQHLQGLQALQQTLQARDANSSKIAYMGAVSPWFFTHYGPNSYNKNFIYMSDQHLYSKRWESVISARDQIDLVEVITWNDYGESHYIGPIKGAQPNSQAWTDGMNHTAWLEMTQYYATAFKTGQYPEIQKDKIYMWSRPHSVNAQCPDPVPQPTNYQLFEDVVWAVVMTTAPSTVTLSVSPTDSTTFQVPAGVSKLAIPISPGGTMKGVIERNGQTIVELNPTEFTFQGSPQTYNFNAFVASATAD